MSDQTTVRDPAQDLADGFAAHIAEWAQGDEMTKAVAAEAARHLSQATSRGHVCVTLDELAALDGVPDAAPVIREQLLASGVTGTADAPRAFPLVLDHGGRLYLHRYFDYERRLARRLLASAQMPAREPSRAALDRLATLFPPRPGEIEPDWQKAAAELALRRGLAVISGGPGTGKTTTVVNLLACLLEQEPGSRIALAAPTGKAAARMTEAIRQRAGHVPAALRERLPAEASTVHRLLRYHPERGFTHHQGNPLPVDVLVVDEASMLDLALATRLLEAVPAGARVVLLGDKDQLAAVESGAVFAELAQRGTLGDVAVWLTRNHRFAADSGIGRLAADINAGRADEAVAWLRESADRGVQWRPGVQDAPELARQGYAAYLETVRRDPRDVEAIHAAFGRFRVLCAVRGGEQGVDAANGAMASHARSVLAGVAGAFEPLAGSPWFTGRPVMVAVNDYARKLFNGDIGIALPDESGEPMVFFPDGGGGWRGIAPVRMPAHETAFAMTVHKSQGSEFDDVLVLLPAHRSAVLARELLYTAVTRARESVTLLATEDALRDAIGRKVARASGLLARLREG